MEMTNMTLALPEELHTLMQRHREIRWSEVAREALWEQARKMEMMERLLEKSKTERDALEIGRKINREIARRHGLKV